MIPLVVAPLRGAAVLVTRPEQQAATLVAKIQRLGGEAILLPAIAIEPITVAVDAGYDLVIFVSVNAVEHGARLIVRTAATRVAAIGKATAAALTAIDIKVDFVPAADSSSEALLAHPELAMSTLARVLIVRGEGGRTLLQESFTALGAQVDLLDVYRRTLPVVDAGVLAAINARWDAGEIDIVTITSVATLHHLLTLLGDQGMSRLRATPLLVASPRILEAARLLGLDGDMILANGADDESMLGALSYWRTRGRCAA